MDRIPGQLSGVDMNASLVAVSALDGRYAKKCVSLRDLMSEHGLMRFRVLVEVEWLLFLGRKNSVSKEFPLISLSEECVRRLMALKAEYSVMDSVGIKAIEAKTNHDLKAVEYYIKQFVERSIVGGDISELGVGYTHYLCTSEDVNNLAYSLSVRQCMREVVQPKMSEFLGLLAGQVKRYAGSPMLAMTHGQAASPVTFGKEMCVFLVRLARVAESIARSKYLGKFSGATGTFGCHQVCYPSVPWIETMKSFVEESLGLEYQLFSTQIECHDWLVELLNRLAHFSQICIGLCRDLWTYSSRGLLTLEVLADEVGSSTMPHKLNPIDFENAEGNFGLCAGLVSHLVSKLPISRLQRDLSDSTVLRSLGTVFGYFMIAIDSLSNGLKKASFSETKALSELEENAAVLAEPIMCVFKKNGIMKGYEILKEATRGKEVDADSLNKVMEVYADKIDPTDLQLLRSLIPRNYVGLCAEICSHGLVEYERLPHKGY